MKRRLDDINDHNLLKKKTESVYVLRAHEILKEPVYLFNHSHVYLINSPVLFSFYIYQEIYFESDKNDIWRCINTHIPTSQFENIDFLVYSDMAFLNYEGRYIKYEIPAFLYKPLIRFTMKYKSPFIRICLYYTIYKQFSNMNPYNILIYLNLNIGITGEFIHCNKVFETWNELGNHEDFFF